MPVRGDFTELERLRVQLERVASGELREGVVRAVAEEAEKQLDDGFRESRDPYGARWAPLTSRTGKPLLDTGAHLRNSLLHPRITPQGFVIATPFIGAAVHQYGATIRAKKGKALAFRAGGARPRGHGRGQTGGFVLRKKVVVPRRQYMPENDVGPIWGSAFDESASTAVTQALGGSP